MMRSGADIQDQSLGAFDAKYTGLAGFELRSPIKPSGLPVLKVKGERESRLCDQKKRLLIW